MSYETPERRKDGIDYKIYMDMLVNNVKEILTTEVSVIKDQIKNLENNITSKISNHEKESDRQIENINYEINCLKTKVGDVENRVSFLEMKPMKHYFNDDNTNHGIEGWYELVDDTLIVYVEPTNIKEDWLSNLKGWSEELYPTSKVKVHAGYRPYAYFLKGYIQSILEKTLLGFKNLVICGYSMGGGIVRVVNTMYFPEDIKITIVNIDGPRASNLKEDNVITYYKKGSFLSFIPPWFVKSKESICLDYKWRPIWKSHYFTKEEIDNILKDYYPR